jgi:hypothetical protein
MSTPPPLALTSPALPSSSAAPAEEEGERAETTLSVAGAAAPSPLPTPAPTMEAVNWVALWASLVSGLLVLAVLPVARELMMACPEGTFKISHNSCAKLRNEWQYERPSAAHTPWSRTLFAYALITASFVASAAASAAFAVSVVPIIQAIREKKD